MKSDVNQHSETNFGVALRVTNWMSGLFSGPPLDPLWLRHWLQNNVYFCCSLSGAVSGGSRGINRACWLQWDETFGSSCGLQKHLSSGCSSKERSQNWYGSLQAVESLWMCGVWAFMYFHVAQLVLSCLSTLLFCAWHQLSPLLFNLSLDVLNAFYFYSYLFSCFVFLSVLWIGQLDIWTAQQIKSDKIYSQLQKFWHPSWI